MFFKTYNTEFDKIIITDKNCRSLEIKDKVTKIELLKTGSKKVVHKQLKEQMNL